MTVVWIPGLNSHRFWRFYFSVFTLVFVSIEKIYQTLETVFHLLSKHFEFLQKYSAACSIFNSLLGVWIPNETLFLVFDILLHLKSVFYSNEAIQQCCTFKWCTVFVGLIAVCFSLKNPIEEQGGVLRQEGIGTKQDCRTQEDLL